MNGKFYHSVYLDEEKCVGCYNCLKRCPTKAIRIENGKSRIISEYCTDCGECIRFCKNGAKRVQYDSFERIHDYEYTVALPTPSLYAQFNHLDDISIVLTALVLLGFNEVFEVSTAAELVSDATRKYVKANPDKWPVISSACPSVVRLIRVKYPNLLENLSPIPAPMEVAAEIARKRAMAKTGLASDKIGIFYISSCPAKVAAVKSPLGMEKSNIDHVLGMKKMYPRLLSVMNKASENPLEFSLAGRIGVGWGVTGGEAAGSFNDSYIIADGMENVVQVLNDLEDDKFQTQVKFIELNACNGGCVGGALTVENPFVASTKLKTLYRYLPVSVYHEVDYPEELQLARPKPIEYEPVYELGSTILESMENMQRADDLLNHLPGLDCGLCGCPSCKTHAMDVVMGRTGMDKCVFLNKNSIRDWKAEHREAASGEKDKDEG